jgi:hypothetical protein
MPNWLIKSAVQRAISLLPQSHRWNELLQNKITKSIELTPARFEQRLAYTSRHLDRFFEFRSRSGESFSVLELGTGWYPVLPVALFLCGAANVWTFDIVSHLNPERIRQTLELFVEYDRRGILAKHVPLLRPERLVKLKEMIPVSATGPGESALEALNIHALVRDAQDTGLPAASADFFCSNSVLEYVPRMALAKMLSEFGRIARPGAVQSHFINLGDEYAKFDRSITPFNFLKYTDSQWAFFDSPFTRKNRLHISDYRNLLTQSGCAIAREENNIGDVVQLESIRLAPQFQGYSQADLLVLATWITARFG